MARRTTPCLTVAAVALTCWCSIARGDSALTLEQTQARSGPDFVPIHEGAAVTVRGIVVSEPVWATDGYLLGIRDDRNYGLALLGGMDDFQGLKPGRAIIASGALVRRAGMAVLVPTGIEKLEAQAAPAPISVDLGSAATFRHLGTTVVTEGAIIARSSDEAGEYLVIGTRRKNVTVFRAKTRNAEANALDAFDAGDRIRVTGLSVQYCPLPPYDRSFQIVILDLKSVVLLERRPFIPPILMLYAVAGLSLILAVWWARELRKKRQRKAMRSMNVLSEEIVAAASASEILKKLTTVVPRLSGAAGVRLYTYNRKSRALDRVPSADEPDPFHINLDSPADPIAATAASAFLDETVIQVPDTRRSPLFKPGSQAGAPRSFMFVPMRAQNETLGVLEVRHAAVRYFTHEEQVSAQHLANQVAASLRLQEQHSLREQLFRSEKLAATGQLISAVANELRSPLEGILIAANRLAARTQDPGLERELSVLSAEAQRASGIVARLISFGRTPQGEARPVELNTLIRGLFQFREREWASLGIALQNRLTADPLYVMGVQGQLEQVFLNALVHAEQSAIDAGETSISVSSGAGDSRVRVDIEFACLDHAGDPFEAVALSESDGLSLGLGRGLLRSQGGDIAYLRLSGRTSRIQIEMPLVPQPVRASHAPARHAGRSLTTLVVEPDAARRLDLVRDLTELEHRSVPVVSAEQALDLVRRLKFDAVFCSSRLPGLNWVEFLERVRDTVGVFVLIADAGDETSIPRLKHGDGFIETSSDAVDLERVLTQVEALLEDTKAAYARP